MLSPEQGALLDEGIALFNAGKHWHAHEAWEHLWLQLDGDDKRFVQGLIMAAAMLVQYGKGVRQGVINHYRNVEARLDGPHWGLNVDGLMAQLLPYRSDALSDRELVRPLAVRIEHL